MKTHRYLFGPVPSRRLGRSLGIDLVPLNTAVRPAAEDLASPVPEDRMWELAAFFTPES